MAITGSEVIQKFIQAYEIKYVFGNPGSTETSFLEALTHCPQTEYILTLQESTTAGIAAGYSSITQRPSLVNIHGYPGLANSLCNMYNAMAVGIPMVVIAGQEDRRHLVHNPVLSGSLTKLAETAVKYNFDVLNIDDLSTILERCYVQSMLPPAGPTFLSIPMDMFEDTTDNYTFKKTEIHQSVINADFESVCKILAEAAKGKMVFISAYEACSYHGVGVVLELADLLSADIYATSYYFPAIIGHSHFKGRLPVMSAAIHDTLAQYDTVVLLGEKIDTLFYTGKEAMPKHVKLIQIAPSKHLASDFACDVAVHGDVHSTLSALVCLLKVNIPSTAPKENESAQEILKKHPEWTKNSLHETIFHILAETPITTPVMTEATSQNALIQDMAAVLGFKKVHFPRGDGLGWAMPFAVGASLALKSHSLCFVGDGGSLYANHAIWTAAKYKIPVVFVCFVNNEYRILKNLWKRLENKDFDESHFIGLDFSQPKIDFLQIAKAMGAEVNVIANQSDAKKVLAAAYQHQGPTFIAVYD